MSRDIADLLDDCYRAMNAAIIERLAASGHAAIRPAHAKVFEHIGREGARVADMAAAAQITKQSMGELVDDLEAAGYVERTVDPADRRAKIVRLTAAGWEAVAIGREVLVAIQGQLSVRLGERRYRALISALSDVLDEISSPPASVIG
jgi:DNA-binding MarR family transcriptional regulator